MNDFLDIRPDIAQAIQEGKPVVALESALIAHGMPFPENVQTSLTLEAIIAEQGALAATIGIMNKRVVVGMTPDQLEQFGKAPEVAKVSRRDLPIVLSMGGLGATTVSGTVLCAHLARIPVLATGGIGGVHRGGEHSLDISADLHELSRADVAVVCSGVKAILDIGRTLEMLETLGVPVLGFGTDSFPAFFTRDSGFGVDRRVDSPEQAAHILDSKWRLGLKGGVVIANPIPREDSLEQSEIEGHILEALSTARSKGISGKAVTPFLLEHLAQQTGNRSLKANIALLESNVALAAQIAIALVNC